jgi:hypothetical protein
MEIGFDEAVVIPPEDRNTRSVSVPDEGRSVDSTEAFRKLSPAVSGGPDACVLVTVPLGGNTRRGRPSSPTRVQTV